MIIAIDGTLASGKGTIAKRLAEIFQLSYLDTGKLYRCVAVAALQQGVAFEDELQLAQLAETIDPDAFADSDLRTAEAGQAASRVAAVQSVRAALLSFQRRFAEQPGGAVLDGRDIGTVICPHADVKIWVDARLEIRAERRWKELVQKDPSLTLEEMVRQLKERDERDRTRATAPMKPATDALLLDSSDLTIDAAVDKARQLVEQKRAET